jgi:predicted oxidoreductase
MQSDEIAEAVLKLKSEGKIIDFGLSNFTNSQTDLIRQKTAVGYNQIQFSATTFEPMIDGRLHANQQYSSYVLESTWKCI